MGKAGVGKVINIDRIYFSSVRWCNVSRIRGFV